MNQQIILGVFDGENMVTETGAFYGVPPNYASKSRLVEGDELKLFIEPNGAFIFKQIHPAERKRVVGKVADTYMVYAEGKSYNVLGSSISYFKLVPGDEVALFIPAEGSPTWAAVDQAIRTKRREVDKEM